MKTLTQIIKWLEDEIKDNQDIVDSKKNGEDCITSDGTDDILIGRHECAEGLLKFIKEHNFSSLPKKAQDRIDTLSNTIFREDGLKHHSGGFVECSVEDSYESYDPVTGKDLINYSLWITSGIQNDVENNTHDWKYSLHEAYTHDGKEYSWAFTQDGKFLDALNKEVK